MKWKGQQMPKGVVLDESVSTPRYGKFVIEPLEHGFGTILGNSLRSVLLSSLQGAAIIAVSIDGALHEFTSIAGVVEDVSEIILNLKQMRFKLHGDEAKKAVFDVEGPKDVVAGDLQADADLELLNPELHIATLNKKGKLQMEVEVGSGRGYVFGEDQPQGDRPIGVVPVDSLFSPVSKVNFTVQDTRVGDRTDYDSLTLEVWTDGSILPNDAVALAAKILRDHYSLFIHFEEEFVEEEEEEVDEETLRVRQLLNKTVEELELSVRAANCLRAANIETIGQLVQKSEQEMLKYRNFGRKSLKEISDLLGDMGLKFGMDVEQYFAKQKAMQEEAEPEEPVHVSADDEEDE
jgi:DNA-directed RNA polymerase subunit alpha